MDPEIQREFEEQLRQMNEMLSQTNSTMAGMVKAIQSQTTAISGNVTSVKTQTDANNQLATSTSGRTKLAEAEAQALQKSNEAKAKFRTSIDDSSSALRGFGRALTSTEEGFKKYGGAVESAGDAAFSIGKNFGILGTVLGGAVKAVTFFASEALSMHDTMIQMNRDFVNFTGVLPVTNREMATLAAEAGYAGESMGKIAKFAANLNQNILALGDTAGQGAVKFAKVAAVGNDVYEKYSAMGISQEKLTEMQTYYIKEQAQSGRALALRTKSEEQLRKESLAYVDNMVLLSSMTGQQAEDMQREREVVKSEFEERVKVRQEELRAQAAEARGDQAEADKIRAESASRRAIIDKYTTLYGQEVGSMVGRVVRQGGFDEFTGGLAAAGVQVEDLTGQMNAATREQLEAQKRGASAEELERIRSDRAIKAAEAYQTAQDKFALNLGDAAQYSKELPEAFAQTTEALGRGENSIGKTVRERLDDAKAEQAAKEKSAKEGLDKDAKMRADQESADRNFQKQWQTSMLALAETIMPTITAATNLAADALGIFNGYLNDINKFFEDFKKYSGAILTVMGLLAGATGIGLAIKMFGGLSAAGKGLTSIFGGLKNAFSGVIGWLQGLIGMGGAGGGGKFLRFAKGAAGGLGGLLGGFALDYGAEKAEESGYTKTAAGLSTGSAALYGAGLGATAGSIIPGLGTAVGGAVGGLLGGAYGLYQNWDGLTSGNQQTSIDQTKTREDVKTNTTKQSVAASKSEKASITTEKASVKTEKSTDAFTKATNSFDKNILTWAKISEAFAKANLAFVLTVGNFNKAIEDFKKFVDEKLMSVGGTYGTQFGGDVDKVLSTIRQRESGNDYQAQAKGSTASGAYQFIDSTWQNLTKKFSIGTEYKSARDAPPAVQDQVAAAYVKDILERAGGDVSKVPLEWYTGNIQGKMSPAAIAANKGQTAEMYQQKWMSDYAKTSPTAGIGQSSPGSDAIVQLGRSLQGQGLRISGHSQFGGQEKGKHSPNSRHYKDLAIDVNVGTGITEANHPEHGPRFDALANQLRASGFNVIWKADGHDDHIHVSAGSPKGVQAAKGGVFSGASSGYPATLHGTEIVAPLTMDSILMKLAKTSALSAEGDMVEKALTGAAGSSASGNTNSDAMLKMHSELINVISSKLDSMIDVLDDGNDTRDKIFKHTMV